MPRFDKKGRLIFPEARALAEKKGLRVGAKALLVSRLYCPAGHSLIGEGNAEFDGEPGIKLLCEGAEFSQVVYLSPWQGDTRKTTARDFAPGEQLTLRCPVCEEPLPRLAPHDCASGAMYVSLFLDSDGDLHNSIAICSTWGCYSSFLRLYSDVITDLRTMLPG